MIRWFSIGCTAIQSILNPQLQVFARPNCITSHHLAASAEICQVTSRWIHNNHFGQGLRIGSTDDLKDVCKTSKKACTGQGAVNCKPDSCALKSVSCFKEWSPVGLGPLFALAQHTKKIYSNDLNRDWKQKHLSKVCRL